VEQRGFVWCGIFIIVAVIGVHCSIGLMRVRTAVERNFPTVHETVPPVHHQNCCGSSSNPSHESVSTSRPAIRGEGACDVRVMRVWKVKVMLGVMLVIVVWLTLREVIGVCWNVRWDKNENGRCARR
jgi:hypothetical protein